MPAPISKDLRERAVQAVRSGATYRAAADQYDVSESSVIRWCRLMKTRGRVDARKMGGDRKSHRTKKHWRKILRWLLKRRDFTLDEICSKLADLGYKVSRSAVWRLLRNKKFTWKRKTGHASEQYSDPVKKRRKAWMKAMRGWPISRLFFIDECSVRTNMGRACGWSRRWERCRGSFPYGHRCTTTLIAALCLKGIVAPFLVNGPMDGNALLTWVEQVLVKELPKGALVVCDNVATHKIAGFRKAIRSVGANLLFLPPYSPDLNPIEMAFAQIKSHLKKIAPRTQTDLYEEVGTAVGLVTPENASNYIRHSGYLCAAT